METVKCSTFKAASLLCPVLGQSILKRGNLPITTPSEGCRGLTRNFAEGSLMFWCWTNIMLMLEQFVIV
jgi:hypothetical protein